MIQPARYAADMHTHTRRSDGTMFARQHMAYASRRGLRAVVITDHNLCRSQDYDAAKSAANQYGLKTMPGIEIYSIFNGVVMDILGYGFDPKSKLNRELEQSRRVYAQWNMNRLVSASESEGLRIDPSSLEQKWDGFWFQWCHASLAIARELGISFQEGVRIFDRHFPEGYVPPLPLSPDQACDLIARAGGRSVIAHPGIYLRRAQSFAGEDPVLTFYDLVSRLKTKHGLIGLELLHPGHSREDEALFRYGFSDLALFFTGGSDFHGLPFIPHCPMGQWGVDIETYDRFEQAVAG